MIPIIAGLIGTLAKSGLGILAGAIEAKGKQVVEDKLGVKISDNPTPEEIFKLKQLEAEHEQALLELSIKQRELEIEELKVVAEAQKAEDTNVTQRWQADMSSDSWLSKNVRPLCLIAILSLYFIFAILSAFQINANESYVRLLGEWGQITMLAYFGSRGAEKIMELKARQK